MRKLLQCSLVVAGIFGATSANAAATYTTDLFYSLANYAKSSLGGDAQWPLISNGADLITYTTPNQMLAIPSTSVSSFVSAFNALLQTPECSASVVGSNGSVGFPQATTTYCVQQTQQLYAKYLNLQPTSSNPSVHVTDKVISQAQTTAVVAQVQRATTIQQAVTIINVLSTIANPRGAMGPQRITLGENTDGMAAGGVAGKWSAWMNVSRAKIGNTYQDLALGADTRFDGNVDNWIGGFDYGLDKDWVVGASIGYDRTSLDTYFNKGNLTSKGVMIAPYASFQLNKIVSMDAIIGYAEGNTDIYSTLITPAVGQQDFTRNFGAVNVSATQWLDNWQLTGKVSYIIAEEKLRNFVDSTGSMTLGQKNHMQQMRVGGQIGYWANGIMPYVGLTYSNDIKAEASVVSGIELPKTRDAYTASIGVNVFAKDLMGSLSYSSEKGRSQSKNNILMGSLSYRF